MKLWAHLDKCGDCRLFMTDLHRVRDLMRAGDSLQERPVPSGFSSSVSRLIFAESGHEGGRKRLASPRKIIWGRLAGVAAAAVLLLVTGWTWHRVSNLEEQVKVAVTAPAEKDAEEGSMEYYLQQHAMRSMGETLLGQPGGVEFTNFVLHEDGI